MTEKEERLEELCRCIITGSSDIRRALDLLNSVEWPDPHLGMAIDREIKEAAQCLHYACISAGKILTVNLGLDWDNF